MPGTAAAVGDGVADWPRTRGAANKDAFVTRFFSSLLALQQIRHIGDDRVAAEEQGLITQLRQEKTVYAIVCRY